MKKHFPVFFALSLSALGLTALAKEPFTIFDAIDNRIEMQDFSGAVENFKSIPIFNMVDKRLDIRLNGAKNARTDLGGQPLLTYLIDNCQAAVTKLPQLEQQDALKKKCGDFAKELIATGKIDVQQKSQKGWHGGNIDCVYTGSEFDPRGYYCSKSPIEYSDDLISETAFSLAVKKAPWIIPSLVEAKVNLGATEKLEAFRALLEKGLFDIASLLIDGEMPLQDELLLQVGQCRLEPSKFLLSKGASAEKSDSKGMYPLESSLFACDGKGMQLPEALILAGADVNAVYKADQSTPLMVMAKECKIDQTYLLVEYGADTSKKNKTFESALDIAVATYNTSSVYYSTRTGARVGRDWYKDCDKVIKILRNAKQVPKKGKAAETPKPNSDAEPEIKPMPSEDAPADTKTTVKVIVNGVEVVSEEN